jgi:hypothetical protein
MSRLLLAKSITMQHVLPRPRLLHRRNCRTVLLQQQRLQCR